MYRQMRRGPVVELAPGTRALGRTFPAAKGVDGSVYAFLGLRYAQPPVGPLRFQPPQRIPLWSGDIDATKYGAICPQDLSGFDNFPGVKVVLPTNVSEDCLFLNVWTQSLDSTANKPVMFFIHGGGFINGYSDMYQGNGLASLGDVVVVVINYRVNIFGFMTTGDDVAKGNFGILDQIEALRWVQKNIRAFGGDPDNVTIFGESAGSISVSYLCLSPLTRGLFRRGVCASGTIQTAGFMMKPAELMKRNKPTYEQLGCTSDDSQEIIDFLRSQPADVLWQNPEFQAKYIPVIDGEVVTQEAVDEGGNSDNNPLDVIFGMNSHEGALFAHFYCGFKCPDLDAAINTFKTFAGDIVGDDADMAGLLDAVKKEYFTDTSTEDALLRSLVDAMGDLVFLPSTVSAAQSRSKGSGKTYLYHYCYRYSGCPYPEWVKADHNAEISQVFGWPFIDCSEQLIMNFDKTDEENSLAVIKYWTNFARTGDPNEEGLVEWPEYNREEQRHLVIDRPCSTDSRLHAARVQFWNDAFRKYLNK